MTIKDFFRPTKNKVLSVFLMITIILAIVSAVYYMDYKKDKKAHSEAMNTLTYGDIEEGLRQCGMINDDFLSLDCYNAYAGTKMWRTDSHYALSYGTRFTADIKSQYLTERMMIIDDVCTSALRNGYGEKICTDFKRDSIWEDSNFVDCKRGPAESKFYVKRGAVAFRLYGSGHYRFFVTDIGQGYCVVDISDDDAIKAGNLSDVILFSDGAIEKMLPGENARRMDLNETVDIYGFSVRVFDSSPDDQTCGIEVIGVQLEECEALG